MNFYKSVARPLLFKLNPEFVHDCATLVGESLGYFLAIRALLAKAYSDDGLKHKKSALGIDFPNPIGLAAGYDYDGHFASVMRSFGFGFNTVGTKFIALDRIF